MKRTEILKYFINILAVVLTGAIAYLFIAYGLNYKNLSFIAVHFNLLLSVSAVIIGIITLAGVLFFVFGKQSIYRLIICLLIFLDICALVFYFLCATGLIGKINSVEALRAYISAAGGWTAVIFIIFCFLQVVLLPVPGSVAVAVGVAMFGPLKCAFFAFIGIITGSIVAFAIGRWIGYKAVCWIVGKESLDKWLNKIKGKDYLILSLMFLLPMFPDDVLCFIAGLSSMGWVYFLIMITITRAISVFSTAYSFELIPFTTWWGILIWAVLVALVALSFWLVCKYSDRIDAFIKSKFKIIKRKR
ncbi:MAG: TVP38/TMEM64 family protein [Clostridiales bacterium]|nr:TVP38/TMEM64 family protein [Clostridiales bacterium]